MAIRILLVDGVPCFRLGLRTTLERDPEVEVLEADDARGAFALCDGAPPDVAVMGLQLAGIDGISAAHELKRRAPRTRVLLVSTTTDSQHAADAFSAGAAGLAFKSQPPDALAAAVHAVASGRTYLPPGLAPPDGDVRSPLETLSRREREIFNLLVRGFSNQAVAKELCISIKTVETHRAQIHRKLNVHRVTELMRFAALRGLIR